MYGGFGNDTFVVDSTGDKVFESYNEGMDKVNTTLSNYTLPANVENLALQGNAQSGYGNDLNNKIDGNNYNNALYGFGGNDVINGVGGSDSMFGGTGDDIYVVDSVGDSVIENYQQGVDAVHSAISYALPSNVENLALYDWVVDGNGIGNDLDNKIDGNGYNNTLDGRGGNDSLNAGGGNDILYGGAGNDILNGGAGNDSMYGGTDNDSYYVDSISDKVIENSAQGSDTVYASISDYILPGDVENLTLSGSTYSGKGNSLANTVTGNDASNALYGYDGVDRLYGNGGNDFIQGGNGADTMYGGVGADQFTYRTSYTESSASTGRDVIMDFSSSQGDKVLLTFDANLLLAGVQKFNTSQFSYNSTSKIFTADVIGGNDLEIQINGVFNPVQDVIVA